MGYTVDLEDFDLTCKSNEDADAAAAIINDNEDFSYHLQVDAEHASVPNELAWLSLADWAGDHWNDDGARLVWLAIAPHMRDGATISFKGEEGDRWRIRWQGGKVFEEYVERVIWGRATEITAETEAARAEETRKMFERFKAQNFPDEPTDREIREVADDGGRQP